MRALIPAVFGGIIRICHGVTLDMPRIALVDDDRNTLVSVAMLLQAEGYDVATFSDGSTASGALRASLPDLVILDVKMPRMDGIELLARLREHSSVPIIMLTAKDSDSDELLGLRMGADDYVKKPFNPKLLIERVRALLRRNEYRETDASLVRGSLVMDEKCHSVMWRGRAVALTVTEFLLLSALAQRPGHVKSRDQLLDATYGGHVAIDDRIIDSHIRRLRKKMRAVDDTFDSIETLYGAGYRFAQG